MTFGLSSDSGGNGGNVAMTLKGAKIATSGTAAIGVWGTSIGGGGAVLLGDLSQDGQIVQVDGRLRLEGRQAQYADRHAHGLAVCFGQQGKGGRMTGQLSRQRLADFGGEAGAAAHRVPGIGVDQAGHCLAVGRLLQVGQAHGHAVSQAGRFHWRSAVRRFRGRVPAGRAGR